MAKYVRFVRWLHDGGFTERHTYTNKKHALHICNSLKDVALIAGQKLVVMETDEILWQSNGWKAAWELIIRD